MQSRAPASSPGPRPEARPSAARARRKRPASAQKATLRAPAIVALLVASTAGCARSPPSGPPPVTRATPEAIHDAASPPEPPWVLDEQLAGAHAVAKPAPSQHFTGDYDGELLAGAAAATYPAIGPDRPLGVGATLIERHLVRGGGAVVVYLAMVKRGAGYDAEGSDWEYLVVLPSGKVEERGRLSRCVRCHAEAPNDFVFGSAR